ncbi:LuxR C-terminal-related transcriptional regulator [Desulfonatronum thioautotrophicum]|uniref:LuxR C-terminal-related transcriptional regulator n=1 Tax=Desulfonatronum thioautotrophicum TaxID=617001 RepID=UPI0006993092|nr:PAS and helix-turn-helix domain-containing protein [Desulfonatronum thioautotrophicum]
MERAGYLEHTTAKVEDCVLSFQWFMKPILDQASQPGKPTFAYLIQDRAWAEKIIQTARRHRGRGVTAEMFLGCFKTLVHALEAMVLEFSVPERERLQTLQRIRLYADALETILVDDWTSLSDLESRSNLDTANRLLTLEKNKYENILASITDLVLVVDSHGRVVEANAAALNLLGPHVRDDSWIWEILGLEGESMDEMLHYYSLELSHEIRLQNTDTFLSLRIIPLSAVSLASRGYILVLNDITVFVNQRGILEESVQQRTEELRREKAQVDEMVITLRRVLQTTEQARADQMDRLAEDMEKLLLPALGRIRKEQDVSARSHYVDLFADQMLGLLNQAGPRKDARLLRLTPTETRICQFIQAGKSSKEMASALNISLGTVNTHRKNIRKKLGLMGKDQNLFNFLQASDHLPQRHPSE